MPSLSGGTQATPKPVPSAREYPLLSNEKSSVPLQRADAAARDPARPARARRRPRRRRRPAGREAALPARRAGRLREHARRRPGALRRRAATSSRPSSRSVRSGRRSARCAPTCSLAGAPRSRGRRRSTATTASAASPRSRRCRRRAAGVGPRRPDATLARRLAAAAASANGAVGIWVHDLSTGRYAGYEPETRFAAASTVKLGALVAGLRASPQVERSRWWYDVRQIGFWSSNLAANRLLSKLGYGAVTDGLRRLGMTSSTYPGPYRATTALPAAGAAHARDDGARPRPRAPPAPRRRARRPPHARPARPDPAAGRRRAPCARLGAGGRRQRRAAAPLARRRDRRREERLALRHAARPRRSSTGAAGRRSSSSSSTGPGVTYAEAKRLGRRVLLAADLL